MYTITSGETTPVSNNSSFDGGQHMSGENIVWVGKEDGDLEVYLVSINRPITTAPADGAVLTNNLRPTYEWKPISPEPSYYKLLIKDASNNVVVSKLYIASDVCNSTTCSVKSPIDLPEGNGYKWFIQGKFSDGTWTKYSYAQTFDIATHITKFTPTYVEKLNIPRPEFSWRNVPWDAAKYQLTVTRKVNGSVVSTNTYQPLESAVCIGITCTFRVTDDYTFGVHAWKLRAYKPSIGWTSYGGEWNIVLNTQIPFIYPRNNDVVDTGTPTFSWDDLDWVEDYEVMIRNASNVTLRRYVLDADSVCAAGQCDWTLAGMTLLDGKDYIWYVRGMSDVDGIGAWGPSKTFAVDLP